jgi:hypothetical protein
VVSLGRSEKPYGVAHGELCKSSLKCIPQNPLSHLLIHDFKRHVSGGLLSRFGACLEERSIKSRAGEKTISRRPVTER